MAASEAGDKGAATSTAALLERLHRLERDAADRERRDAAVVDRLQREVADLEERLLDAYTRNASVIEDYRRDTSPPPQQHHNGSSYSRPVSPPPRRLTVASVRRQHSRLKDQLAHESSVDGHLAADRTNSSARRTASARSRGESTDKDANGNGKKSKSPDPAAASGHTTARGTEDGGEEEDRRVYERRLRAVAEAERQLESERHEFHREVTMLEDTLAGWEAQLQAREQRVRAGEQALRAQQHAFEQKEREPHQHRDPAASATDPAGVAATDGPPRPGMSTRSRTEYMTLLAGLSSTSAAIASTAAKRGVAPLPKHLAHLAPSAVPPRDASPVQLPRQLRPSGAAPATGAGSTRGRAANTSEAAAPRRPSVTTRSPAGSPPAARRSGSASRAVAVHREGNSGRNASRSPTTRRPVTLPVRSLTNAAAPHAAVVARRTGQQQQQQQPTLINGKTPSIAAQAAAVIALEGEIVDMDKRIQDTHALKLRAMARRSHLQRQIQADRQRHHQQQHN